MEGGNTRSLRYIESSIFRYIDISMFNACIATFDTIFNTIISNSCNVARIDAICTLKTTVGARWHNCGHGWHDPNVMPDVHIISYTCIYVYECTRRVQFHVPFLLSPFSVHTACCLLRLWLLFFFFLLDDFLLFLVDSCFLLRYSCCNNAYYRMYRISLKTRW